MANPMHCDAQRNALGLSLQSIAFFPAPNTSEISIFVPMYRQERNYAILGKGRGIAEQMNFEYFLYYFGLTFTH